VAFFVLHPAALKESDIFPLAIRLLLAFVLTLFISTANYIVNEIADAPYDAYHPSKKNRPLVKAAISKKVLIGLWCILVFVSLVISLIFHENLFFLFDLLALLIAGILYNVPPIRVKDIPFLDSTLESANNPIRFLIGWHIMSPVFPPAALLISWWAFGNFLMVGKRVAEKKFLSREESAGYRLSLKKYSLENLVVFMAANAVIFMVAFALFAMTAGLKTFLFALPFILVYLVMFMKKSVQDIEGAEEPEKLLKNPYFAVYTLFLVVIFVLAYIFK
jgi:4-hydroxybenzoate polyprenyltransferase